ncbi:MAG: hypothetical protein M3457_19615 [Chloroflexota bacterium]|nr:hypothetical protein [Chloroflexota bacterium]
MDPSVTSNRTLESVDADDLLPHVGGTIRDNVASLLLASILLMAAAYPALFLASGASWAVAWPVLVLCAAPVWAGIIASCGRLLDGDAVSPREVMRAIHRQARTGIGIGVAPAIAGVILLGSIAIMDRHPDAGWLAVPLLLDLGLAIVIGLAMVPIFAIAAMCKLSGIDLWLASAGVVIARPVPVLGIVTLFGIVLWLSAVLGPVTLLALAPLAVLCTAITRGAVSSHAESG